MKIKSIFALCPNVPIARARFTQKLKIDSLVASKNEDISIKISITHTINTNKSLFWERPKISRLQIISIFCSCVGFFVIVFINSLLVAPCILFNKRNITFFTSTVFYKCILMSYKYYNMNLCQRRVFFFLNFSVLIATLFKRFQNVPFLDIQDE